MSFFVLLESTRRDSNCGIIKKPSKIRRKARYPTTVFKIPYFKIDGESPHLIGWTWIYRSALSIFFIFTSFSVPKASNNFSLMFSHSQRTVFLNWTTNDVLILIPEVVMYIPNLPLGTIYNLQALLS